MLIGSMFYVKCSAYSTSGSGLTNCDKRGIHACSKCRLLRYCSKQCQESHWNTHKKDCKHPYNRPDWKPAWLSEGRTPAFVADDEPQTHFATHWAPEYLWGNTPAVNCLQLERNEGVSESVERDFNLCFAASGDIRNLVMTVNGLPDNYQGRCKILLNDRSDHVTTRNILILYALLRNGPSPELAAESAIHFMYSAALCPSDSSELRHCIDAVYGEMMSVSQSLASRFIATLNPNDMLKKSFPIRGGGSLSIAQYAVNLFGKPLAILQATHSIKDCLKAMHDVVLSPERVDYRDRYLSGLRPSHRLSWLRFHESGVLLPFADPELRKFQDPNQLLFTASGKWISMDSANPLFSWNLNEVVKTGQAYGLDPADIYGCLFFHVKAQFMEFAHRVEKFHIDIHVSQLDAHIASGLLQKGELNPALFGTNTKFDRIETSNIADYAGIPSIIQDWSPLLNRENKNALILVYLMNWVMKQPDASFTMMGAGMGPLAGTTKFKTIIERTCSMLDIDSWDLLLNFHNQHNPAFYNVFGNVDVFLDNHKQLQEYLSSQGIDYVPRLHKLQLRSRNQICPKRFGVPLGARPDAIPSVTKTEFYNIYMVGGCNPGDRFLEFEMSGH
ncbi:hypothetical protein J3R30DRAFT_1598287 [Lentinula aciculospora]|uniref:MYND-type domain-containing protein n=1 Tax=Lentinula aciculospora TaxID=153920 RepID=A0A9W8ZXL8_9AGAR|nr:hypothetical protein J3R30DRAFT_1598287 [Lentinula aciculospora]